MRNKSNNAQTKQQQQQQAAAANMANHQVMINNNMAATNIEEINMILAAQTMQQNQAFNQQNIENATFQHQYVGQPVSLALEGQKKSQGQIMLATASGVEHGTSSSNINRKHSPFRRNLQQKPNQSALAAKQMQAQMAITQTHQHSQWMNQTMPVNINKVEGGGSGGSGGSGSQEQINENIQVQVPQPQQMQKKSQHQHAQQQQRMQQQAANQIANMKNVMLIDQMYQLQQNPPQPVKQQVRARSNMQQPPGMQAGQLAHNQYLAQKSFLANVNSEMQIQTITAGIKKGSYISQKRKQISKDQGNFETVQDPQALMATQSSKQRINATHGQSSGQMNSQNLRVSNHTGNAVNSKKNSGHATTSTTLQPKKAGHHERKATIDQHAYGKNEQQLLDQHIIQQNMTILMNQQQMIGNYRNAANTLQAFNNAPGKGSRQGSKLRKNISNMRGGAQTQLKNAQRLSQQRRFNNTTLENYQPQIATNQLQTLQAVAPPALKNNNLTIQQQSSLVPSQHFVHHHNTSSKYEQQIANNNQTASNLLKATGGQGIVPVQGAPAGSGHSRSVIRHNQQQKQYMNNFLAPNKYNSTHMAGQGQEQRQTDFTNQIRINNQIMVNNKNEPRSKSNLKAPYGQTFGSQMTHLIGPQSNDNNQNAQFNNYLSQQNYFDNSKVAGQSPLLKKNHAGGHKKSESVTHQRPPEQIHTNAKGHSNSIEPNPNGHKNNFSALGQLNTVNNPILQNISNPNVNLYQQYNNYKGKNTVDSIAQEAKNSIQTSIKVKKCDSELSNGTAGHNQLSGDAAIGGRTSSNDQDGNVHHTGGMQQLRRNQPHNFSNISEKSSIMGDYGGTHTTHNSNQAKKSRQGMGGGIMGIMGSNQQVPEHQQFFKNRNGSASHVEGTSNKATVNVNNSSGNSTHNTSNPAHGGNKDANHPGSGQRNVMSNGKNKTINKQFIQGQNGSNPPSALPSGSNLSNADPADGAHSIKAAQRGGNVPGSAGRQNSGQQQRHSRNASSKFQTQVVNMPGINNNKRIVIGQKQMQAHNMGQQQQMMLQTEQAAQSKLPNANQMTAFQALQNQQQMQQHLQQLQKQQPQLKNVLRSGPRSNEPQNQVAQVQKKGAQKFRKNNPQQNTQQAAQPNRLVAKAQHAGPNHQMALQTHHKDNRGHGGMNPHGPAGMQGNVDFGLVVDPMTMQGVIQDTLEQVPNQTQYDGSNNRAGARRLSMPVPYQKMHATMQGPEKDHQQQQKQGGPAGKMLQAKLEIGHGIRAAGVAKNNHGGIVPNNGNTGALDSGTKNHLYSEDHENYDFEEEELHEASNTLDQHTVDMRTGKGQQQKLAQGGGKAQPGTQTGLKGAQKEVQVLKQPAPTQHQRVIIDAQAPQHRIGAQDQIVIKDNNVYLRNPSGDLADTNRLGRLVPLAGPGANQNLRHMLQTGENAKEADIVIQDESQNKQQKGAPGKTDGARPRGAKEGDDTKVINYETFESSSEDEYSCGAFESAAASFQNKEKNDEAQHSGVQDQKRLERQRRKERKALEKRKQKEEQDRQGRNNIRKKYRIQSVGIEQYDQYQDDILNFKDSDRESLISYFENNSDHGKSRSGLMLDDNFFYRQNALDTPTRLLNHSNEFLPKKKKINADKLATRAKQDEQLMKNIKNFQDIEQMSNLEKSQKSTMRKAEEEKKDMLFKIVSKTDMEKLRTTLRSQLAHEK